MMVVAQRLEHGRSSAWLSKGKESRNDRGERRGKCVLKVQDFLIPGKL
jgi:hypothetical protein